MSYRIRKDCRLCRSTKLETVLELAPTPPANEFVRFADPPQELIPLYLAQCQYCGHVQLPVVVDPERLFRNYVYVSGTSPAFVDHFRRYAEACIEELGLQPGDLVVDIGSNDGTLLRQFQLLGMTVLGIDPAKEIAKQATQAGIETWSEFFTRDTAERILARGRCAALVVANNVFAHADDLKEIALGVKDLLDPERGRFVFEVQYLVDLIEKTLFDMIYHEHLSYHTLDPLDEFFHSLNMELLDAQRVSTHGGSIRCVVAPDYPRTRITRRLVQLCDEEVEALERKPFERLESQIEKAEEDLDAFFERATDAGWKVAGYGAPAKLTTLCHQFGITADDVAYVVDDSPWKQGLLTPGTRIPVVPASHLAENPPDRIVIFAWNFADQIAAKLRASGFAGTIVVPLPTYREI